MKAHPIINNKSIISEKHVHIFNPLTTPDAARRANLRRYDSFIDNIARGRLVPVPISTLRGWHLGAYALRSDVARNVAVRTMETWGKVPKVLTQKHAAAPSMLNAACMMASLQPVF